jgi:lipopolysaccharide transport system permease protein
MSEYSGRLFCSPLAVFTSGWRQRTVILRLAGREIAARYRGSMLGWAWSLLVPILLLLVYTFVFSVVMKARWDMPIEGKGVFALVLFSGLIPFNVFAEIVQRAPSLMLDHVGYIKKLVFPLEALAWVTALVALFNALVSTIALMLGYLIIVGVPPVSALTYPVVIIPLTLSALGLSWFLSSLGVYLRDTQQFVPVLVTMLLFLNPIFYPLSAVPAELQPIVRTNPLAVAIDAGRNALFNAEDRFWGDFPAWGPIGLITLLAWLIAWLGFMWFNKTRKGFADVV